MRLSLQTDYGLRTLMYLASRPDRSGNSSASADPASTENATSSRVTVGEVAEFFQIPATNVAKVVNQLARLGFVRSVRGVGGGVELALPANEIRLGEVIQSLEGNLHLLDCVGTDGVCVIQTHCRLRTVLSRAEQVQTEYLNGVTLQDVLPIRVSSEQPLPPRSSRRTQDDAPQDQLPAGRVRRRAGDRRSGPDAPRVRQRKK